MRPCLLPEENPRDGMSRNCGTVSHHMCHSLNSLKGGYMGDYIGDYYRGY